MKKRFVVAITLVAMAAVAAARYWDMPKDAIKVIGILIGLTVFVLIARRDFVRVRDDTNKKK